MALDFNVKMEYMDSEMMPDTHNVTLEETANALQTVNVCHSPNPMDGLIFSPLLSNDIKMEPTINVNMEQEHYLGQMEQVNGYSQEEFQEPFDLEMTPDQLEASFNIQPPIDTRKFKKQNNTKKSSMKNVMQRKKKVNSSQTDSRDKNPKLFCKPNKLVVEKGRKNITFGKKHQCELCNLIFPQAKMLVKHKKIHKKIQKTFPCTTCKKSFGDIISLLKHSRIHLIGKNCNVCSKSFNDAAALKAHKKTHMGEKPFKCDVCSKSFFNVTSLKSHGKSHVSRKLFDCDVCSKSFKNQITLSNHMASHKTVDKNLESEPSKPNSTDDKADETVDVALKSRKMLKPTGKTTDYKKKKIDCDICKRSFKNYQVLNFHMASHKNLDTNLETDPPKPNCIEGKADDVVDDSPTSSSGIKKPLSKPPSKTPFKCEVCNKSLKTKMALRFHSKIHKSINLENESLNKPDRNENDDVHKASEINKMLNVPQTFDCHVCGESFKNNKALKFHSKTHKILRKRKSLEREPLKTDENVDKSDAVDNVDRAVDVQGEDDTCTNFDDTDGDVDGAVGSGGEAEDNREDATDITSADVDERMDIRGEAEDNREGADVDERMDIRGEAEDNREDPSDITDKEQIECVVCFKPFDSFENLEVHMKTHSSNKSLTSESSTFMCDVCGKNLSSYHSLLKHSRLHTGEKPFVCDICGAAFSDKGALTKHSVTHSRERNHCCEICGRGFGLAGQLTRHMSVHSDEKPFKCKVCDRAYKRKTQCNMHFKKHHCDWDTDAYKVERAECNQCKRLVKKKYMEEHMKTHDEKFRLFICEICALSFVRKPSLLRHMKTHTGEKPYKCDREGCEMAYLAKSDLYRHIRNFHEKCRPFTCDVCKKTFFDQARLDLHSSLHTGKYRFTCDNCGNKFNYRSRYLKHLARTPKCKRKPEQREKQKSDSMGQNILISASNFSEQFSLFAGSTNNGQSTQAHSGVANYQRPESVAKPLFVSHPLFVTSASPKQPNTNGGKSTYNTLDVRDLLEYEDLLHGNAIDPNKSPETNRSETSKLPASESRDVKESQPHRFYKCDVCNERFSSSDDLQTHIMHHLKSAMSPRADDREVSDLTGPGATVNSQGENSGQWLNQRVDPLFDAPQLKASSPAVVDQKVSNDFSISSDFGAAEYSDEAGVADDDDSDYDGLPGNDDNGIKEEDGLNFEKSVHTEDAELMNQEESGQGPVNINGNKAMEIKSEIKTKELHDAKNLTKSKITPPKEKKRKTISVDNKEPIAAAVFDDGDSDDGIEVNVSFILDNTFSDHQDGSDSSERSLVKSDTSVTEEQDSSPRKSKKKKMVPKQDGDKIFPCDFCRRTFPTEKGLNRHLVSHKEFKRPSEYKCEACGKTFDKKYVFQRHLKSNTNKTGSFACVYCGEKFDNYCVMKRHQLTHGSNDKVVGASHICEICGREFEKVAYLTHHRRRHSDFMPYSCEICGRKFKERGSLSKHVTTHSDVKPHQCEQCGRGFRLAGQLTRHLKDHLGLKPYQCPICQKSFSRREYCKIHVDSHSSPKLEKETSQCYVCGKSVKHLSHHMKTHIGDSKPYACLEKGCHKSYTDECNLKRHVMTHVKDGHTSNY